MTGVPGWDALAVAALGALVAGFVTGFAGFGTGLVAAGFWLHALPAPMVPPLVAIASVGGQLVGLATVRRAFHWGRAAPFLLGAVAGVPLGVMALEHAAPGLLKLAMGGFLILYAGAQLCGIGRFQIGERGGRTADGLVGVGGGFLGGFAGLSGPLPLVWLQLRGGPPDAQRAVYQPFNLLVLAAAAGAMAVAGRIDAATLAVAGACLPATLAGAWFGARAYRGVSEAAFKRAVLVLLLASGLLLLVREGLG